VIHINEIKCNVGKTESIFRIAFGAIIILMGLYFRNWLGIIGIVPIITGAIRYCPLNDILGISTCEENKQN
jgi:hypothetical protein